VETIQIDWDNSPRALARRAQTGGEDNGRKMTRQITFFAKANTQ
jgi:hypothetical protein